MGGIRLIYNITGNKFPDHPLQADRENIRGLYAQRRLVSFHFQTTKKEIKPILLVQFLLQLTFSKYLL